MFYCKNCCVVKFIKKINLWESVKNKNWLIEDWRKDNRIWWIVYSEYWITGGGSVYCIKKNNWFVCLIGKLHELEVWQMKSR